jgi:ribosomal protein L7/L12
MDKIMFLIVLNIGLLVIVSISIVQLKKDIKFIKNHLNKIAKEVGVSEPYGIFQIPDDDKINSFMKQGKKIEAIKRYRELTGADLKEANDYINKLDKFNNEL